MEGNTTSDSRLSGVAVDVVVLAVIIALHVTKRDQNLKLILVVLLVVHVMATTRRFSYTPPTAKVADETFSDQSADITPEVPSQTGNLGSARKDIKIVANSGYNRQFTSPDQLSKTREILPTTSAGANGKLVESRTRFFKDIIDV